MRFLLVVVVSLCAVGAAAVGVGHVPVAADGALAHPEEFMPLGKVWRWRYAMGTSGEGYQDVVIEENDSERGYTGSETTKLGAYGTLRWSVRFIVRTDGIYKWRKADDAEATTVKVLGFPLRVGTSWNDEDNTYRISRAGFSLATAAGKFSDCVEVDWSFPKPKGGHAKLEQAWCRGIGQVKTGYGVLESFK